MCVCVCVCVCMFIKTKTKHIQIENRIRKRNRKRKETQKHKENGRERERPERFSVEKSGETSTSFSGQLNANQDSTLARQTQEKAGERTQSKKRRNAAVIADSGDLRPNSGERFRLVFYFFLDYFPWGTMC